MDDEQLLNNIRELLHDTFSNESQVHQSESMLQELSENDERFTDVISYIAINDTDISIKKAAIIQSRNFNPENIVKLFVLFNEQLDPNFHGMITFLSDLLAEKYTEILYTFCINFGGEEVDGNFSDEGIIQKKTLMMAILSLLKNINTEFYETDEFSNLKSSFNRNLLQNAQYIHQILQSNLESEVLNISQQQILFFNYFIQVFYKYLIIMIIQKDNSYLSAFYEFIHFFLCFSLRFNIDFIFNDLNTKMVNTLLGFYSHFFEPNDSRNPLLQNIRFDEIIDNFEIYSRNVSMDNWSIHFLENIKSFFDSEIVFEKYCNYTEQIISNYLFPLFSYNFYSNITDDFEFVDLYYPNKLDHNLQSDAIKIIASLNSNKQIQEIMYKFAYEKLSEMIPNEQNEDIFGLINMMSYFSCLNREETSESHEETDDYLINFCGFIDNNLLNSEDPLIIISVMHFLSEIPQISDTIPSNFINFIIAGLFNQIPISSELLNYENIIQYFSVLAYTNFLSYDECPSFSDDQEKMSQILELTIGFNEYFKTEPVSSSLISIIGNLNEIDDDLLARLVETVWQLFTQNAYSNPNDCLTSSYINSLTKIFEKCTDQVKFNSSEMILNLFDEFLHSYSNSDEDAKVVFHVLDFMNDEILTCIDEIIEFLTNVLPNDQFNDLFIKIRDEISIIFNLLATSYFDWSFVDDIILKFVNLKEKIDHRLLLEFFESLIQLIINYEWQLRQLSQLDSLEEFKNNYSSFPDVQEFFQKYQDEIQHIYEIIARNKSEEVLVVIGYPQ